MDGNSQQPELNWKDSIAANITFFRDQSKLLGELYNPSQVASGALMTILIMNHNMITSRLELLDRRLELLEKLINDSQSSGD